MLICSVSNSNWNASIEIISFVNRLVSTLRDLNRLDASVLLYSLLQIRSLKDEIALHDVVVTFG